jgi:acyl dehydratase
MGERTLSSPPSLLALYARAAVSMVPGASLLPFVPGGGGEIPQLRLALAASRPDPERVAAYAKVCGFSLRDTLPPTYPHVLAFPLQMAAMADGRFPFGAVGLVHVENRIVQRRPVALGEELEIAVRTGELEPHPSGRAFSLTTEGLVAGEPVWEGLSTFLRRGGASGGHEQDGRRKGEGEQDRGGQGDGEQDGGGQGDGEQDGRQRDGREQGERALLATAEWRLAGDLGRRYAAVSGDRNPIHMHSLSAKALGFPRAIAHGMWTKARCLAALEGRLPDAFAVQVSFRKPILLPAQVGFMERERDAEIDFAVMDGARQKFHLQGSVETLESNGGGRK